MQNILKIKMKLAFIAGILILFTGCEKDFLDREPPSDVTPGGYLKTESDLAAYTIARYNFPTHGGYSIGTFGIDNHTDNQATSSYSNRWVPGEWRVPQTGGSWNFGNIRQVNYFLETVIPRWEAGEIQGTTANIDHYIGEAYFLRAYEYFSKVQAVGDFPIVKTTLTDDMDLLVEASKRRPRNEVARFIIEDLDKAIALLQTTPPGGKNRISQYAAELFKSRVALHEATWLKYHKGTAFVPGGPNWPGEGKVEGFSINIDAEIDYFLTEAMESSANVADVISLTPNTPSSADIGYDSSSNPYFTMFADENLEGYPEVLLWRDYDEGLGVFHFVNHYLNRGEGESAGGGSGYTRGLVDNFLMENGLPIYASGAGYAGDDYIKDVKKGRDQRLQLFLKEPGELKYTDIKLSNGDPYLLAIPDFTGLEERRSVTGYSIKKGLSYLSANSDNSGDVIGSIVFRATEAYLNYIEASYLKEGSIDGTAAKYWRAIRERAGVNSEYSVTAAATDISKEAQNDFGAYSAGTLLNDPILYNIRRERRVELMSEGMRYFDLKRWRALDQLKSDPHIIEGFKIWGPMKDWYSASELIQPSEGGSTATVSSSSESDYFRPYRVNLGSGNLVADGYHWAFAHYLDPIATEHFIITTAQDGSESVIYQNPGWSKDAGSGAEF